MVNNTNTTYVDFSKLNETPQLNVTQDFTIDWFVANFRGVFDALPFLEIITPAAIFFAMFVLFRKQEALNLTNMQYVLASSFITFFFVAMMLYMRIYNSFIMFSLSFVLWLIAVGSTVRDR